MKVDEWGRESDSTLLPTEYLPYSFLWHVFSLANYSLIQLRVILTKSNLIAIHSLSPYLELVTALCAKSTAFSTLSAVYSMSQCPLSVHVGHSTSQAPNQRKSQNDSFSRIS